MGNYDPLQMTIFDFTDIMTIDIPTDIKNKVDNLNYWDLRKISLDLEIAKQRCYVVCHLIHNNGGMTHLNNDGLDVALEVLKKNGIITD